MDYIVIHPYPSMGTSPDGVVHCECCGEGLVEFKCPYSCAKLSFLEKATDTTFFLQNDINGELSLNVYHAYYFQV